MKGNLGVTPGYILSKLPDAIRWDVSQNKSQSLGCFKLSTKNNQEKSQAA